MVLMSIFLSEGKIRVTWIPKYYVHINDHKKVYRCFELDGF